MFEQEARHTFAQILVLRNGDGPLFAENVLEVVQALLIADVGGRDQDARFAYLGERLDHARGWFIFRDAVMDVDHQFRCLTPRRQHVCSDAQRGADALPVVLAVEPGDREARHFG